MPLEGMRRRAWTATTERPAFSTELANSAESVRQVLETAEDSLLIGPPRVNSKMSSGLLGQPDGSRVARSNCADIAQTARGVKNRAAGSRAGIQTMGTFDLTAGKCHRLIPERGWDDAGTIETV